MSSLALNSSNDIYFDSSKKLVLISDSDSDDEIKQRVRIRLKSFKGEWFLNNEYGVPYFSDILGTKSLDLNIAESLLRKEINSVKGVASFIESLVDFDKENREIIYTFTILTTNNTKITDNIVI